MALFQINDPNVRGTGHEFGKDLGNSLEMLLGHKTQQLKRHGAQERNFHALLAQGFPEQQATAYSQLPDETLRDFFKENLLRSGTGATGQPQQASSPYEQLLSQLQGTQSQQSMQQQNPAQQQGILSQLMGGQTGQTQLPQQAQPQLFSGALNALGQPTGQQVIPTSQGGAGFPSGPMGGMQPQGQPLMGQQVPQQQMMQQSGGQQPISDIERILSNPNIGARPAERMKLVKQLQDTALKEAALDEKRISNAAKAQDARQQRIIVENRPWRKEHTKELILANQLEQEYSKLKDLLQTGKVELGFIGARKPTAFTNAETQLFDKGASAIAVLRQGLYKGRATNESLKAIERTKPNLNVSPQANYRLIEDGLEEISGIKRRDEFANYLKEQNDGNEPADLGSKVIKMDSDYLRNPIKYAGILNQEPLQQSEQKKKPEEQQEYNADDETLLGYLARQAARGAGTIAGSFAGLPGDIAAAGLGVGNYLSSGKIPSYSQVQEALKILPPTSAQIGEKLGEVSKGYLKPQSSADESIDNIIGMASLIFGPSKALGVGRKLLSGSKGKGALETVKLAFEGTKEPLKKALSLATGAEAAGKTAELFGAEPLTQSIAKMGYMTLAGMPRIRKQIESVRDEKFKLAEQAFGHDKQNVSRTISEIDQLKAKFKRQAVPYKDELNAILDDVHDGLSSVSNNKIPVNDLIKLEQGLNARFKWSNYPKVQGDKGYLPRELRKPLMEVKDVISQPINRAGIANKVAGEAYAQAKDLHKGLMHEGFITDWLSRHGKIPLGFSSSMTKLLLKKGLAGITEWLQKYPKAFDALSHSGTQKLFKEFMKEATADNSRAAIRALAKLDKFAQHYEK